MALVSANDTLARNIFVQTKIEVMENGDWNFVYISVNINILSTVIQSYINWPWYTRLLCVGGIASAKIFTAK